MPTQDPHYGARTAGTLPKDSGQALGPQESLDGDLGRLVNVVASIG